MRSKNKQQRKNENKEREEIEVNKETKTKQYIQPPVVSHDSQLPSIACEEINNGKLFASLHNISAVGIEKPKEEESKEEEVKDTSKEITKTKKKKYVQPPIVSHSSQLPSIASEEISGGKIYAS